MSEHGREERLGRTWVANADAWTDAVRGGRIESRRAGTDAAVLAAVRARRATRVLDAGCGEGWLVRALAADGIDAVGFDGSVPLIERARAAGGGRFEALSYEAFAEAPERLGGPFDAVVFNFSLLGERVEPAVRGAARVLAPGGAVLIQTVHPRSAAAEGPYADGWREEDFAPIGPGFEPMPWYFRTLGSWLDLLAAEGLRLAACREPISPESGEPLSIILVAEPR